MAQRTARVIMNGVTGRMGYRQHLVRSILAIRDDGGVSLPDGSRIMVEPILVGRNADKLATLAAQHGVADYTTSLDEALSDESATIYFDAQVTSERKKAILSAVGAGKHIYTEKPIAESVPEGIELVNAARDAGVINGVVHDKLYLPGLVKLKRLIDSGFFGPHPVGPRRVRLLGVRGRPGAGPAAELELPGRGRRRHRARHVPALELRAGEPVRAGAGGDRQGGHPHPGALGRAGPLLRRDGRRRRVRDLRAGGRHPRPGQLLLGRTRRPRRAGRVPGGRHPRLRRGRPVRLPDPAPGLHADAGLEPGPADHRGLPRASGRRSRTTPSSPTGSGRSGSSS